MDRAISLHQKVIGKRFQKTVKKVSEVEAAFKYKNDYTQLEIYIWPARSSQFCPVHCQAVSLVPVLENLLHVF